MTYYDEQLKKSSIAQANSVTTVNPDTGAAELMSPGSIGAAVQTSNTPPSDYTGKTAEDWNRELRRQGWGRIAGFGQIPPHPPGYIAPPPLMVTVQNKTFGVMNDGTTSFPSIESALQRAVQGLVGAIITQDWTDTRVASHLTAIALDSDAWNGDADPGAKQIPALVAKYTQVYRVAVTPA